MSREDEYFKSLNKRELWNRYCGYLDYSVDEFIQVQARLLLEQIDLVAGSVLGKKIMNGRKPKTVDEFRRVVPLTKYDDYEPHLSEKDENALAVTPVSWCHSSGRGGKFKWMPYTSQAADVACRTFVGYLILAAARQKGEVRIKPRQRILYNLAPRPYLSGFSLYSFSQAFRSRLMPPPEEAEKMSFRERIQKGFQLALREGVDIIFSISSILVKAGERMAEQAQGTKFSIGMLHPRILSTLLRGITKSKLEGRKVLPKDLWRPRVILCGGADTAIYRDGVKYYWGKMPFEVYGSTECVNTAAQNWTQRWLSFLPHSAFWEFIPEEESMKAYQDSTYLPSTVLLNGLEEGKLYEVVLTQFYGMPLLRYRMGDIVKVVAMSDAEAGVKLPQFVFHTRIGETIDLAGLCRLTEKVIWQAINDTGIKYEDWSACKEYDHDKTFLRIYLEPKEQTEVIELERRIDEQLKKVDVDYQDISGYLELQPVRVKLLSKGTFERYYQEKVREGADMTHLKPPHMNAPNKVIERLLELNTKE
jgi:hypothetical protein